MKKSELVETTVEEGLHSDLDQAALRRGEYSVFRQAGELKRFLVRGDVVICECDGTSRAVRSCLATAETLHTEQGGRKYCKSQPRGHEHLIAVMKCGEIGFRNVSSGIDQ